jgi:hypothetical protein
MQGVTVFLIATRKCEFVWRCLNVVAASPNPHMESSVNVEFDDGDSGRIPLSHIRLLPSDFPLVSK